MLIVLALLGILAAVALPTIPATDVARLKAAALLLATDIEWTQAQAMQTGQPLWLEYVGGNRYQVVDATVDPPRVIRHPQTDSPAHGGQYVVDFDDPGPLQGVRVAEASFGTRGSAEFSAYGEPATGGSIRLQCGRLQLRILVAPVTGIVTIGGLESTP
jgi:type II secretory pathway pseudopilin PulG